MFSKRNKATPIDTLIGEGTQVQGDVVFSGGLRIDGAVKGNVVGTGDKPCALLLSEKGRIDGEIRAGHVVINGEVLGQVYAADFVELMAKARVTGDVAYRAISVHIGAVVTGRLLPDPRPKDVKVLQLKPQTNVDRAAAPGHNLGLTETQVKDKV